MFQIVNVGVKSSFDSWDEPNKKLFNPVHLSNDQFLLPGFIDSHIHAPQVPNIGLGLDKPLMEWLNAYTFPIETQYKNEAFAKHVYEKVVVCGKTLFCSSKFHLHFYLKHRTLENGTTTACYFGTIHKTACKILADQAHDKGQRALIGKVAMNQNSPDFYV